MDLGHYLFGPGVVGRGTILVRLGLPGFIHECVAGGNGDEVVEGFEKAVPPGASFWWPLRLPLLPYPFPP